ncbi:MAG: hypothetical protein R3220_00900 [Balneolaceae bacterium]|nr:hypothetical protein [Balneolaceae bacterium]
MKLENLKNEIITTLKICKREEEAAEVIADAQKKMIDKNIDSSKRYNFWKEIYENLGERDFIRLEDEAKSSVNRIVKISRNRIERIMEQEK